MPSFPSFNLTLADDTVVRVDIWPADFCRLEEQIGRPAKDDTMGFREIMTLTWLASKRAKRIDSAMSMDDYLDTVKDFDRVEDDAVDPTNPTTSPSTT